MACCRPCVILWIACCRRMPVSSLPLDGGAVVVVPVVVVVAGVGGPFETFRRTHEPCGACWRPGGFCATTVPFGCDDATCAVVALSPPCCSVETACCCDCPTTFGTDTATFPFAICSTTFVPGFARAPGFG